MIVFLCLQRKPVLWQSNSWQVLWKTGSSFSMCSVWKRTVWSGTDKCVQWKLPLQVRSKVILQWVTVIIVFMLLQLTKSRQTAEQSIQKFTQLWSVFVIRTNYHYNIKTVSSSSFTSALYSKWCPRGLRLALSTGPKRLGFMLNTCMWKQSH